MTPNTDTRMMSMRRRLFVLSSEVRGSDDVPDDDEVAREEIRENGFDEFLDDVALEPSRF